MLPGTIKGKPGIKGKPVLLKLAYLSLLFIFAGEAHSQQCVSAMAQKAHSSHIGVRQVDSSSLDGRENGEYNGFGLLVIY